MRKAMTKDQSKAAARITDQFHGKEGMVYELKCDGVALSISMIASKQETQWEVEATAKVLPDPVVAKGVGRSRAEAFSVLQEAWCSQRTGAPFPRFEWEAIRNALASVRAI
jgi:hypothetical protein